MTRRRSVGGAFLALSAAAAVVAAGGLFAASAAGCASRRAANHWRQPAPFVQLENPTKTQARIVFVSGKRDPAGRGVVDEVAAPPLLLTPGHRTTYTFGSTPVPASQRVVRFKVETVGPSWEEPVVSWYEIVGPLPRNLRLLRPQNGAIAVEADGGDVRPIPPEFWPKAASEPATEPASPTASR